MDLHYYLRNLLNENLKLRLTGFHCVCVCVCVCVRGYIQIHYQPVASLYIYCSKLPHVSATYPGFLQGATNLVDMYSVSEIIRRLFTYTGLFISPSGISDPCGTVSGIVTPKGSMSTEGETLQVSVLPCRCSIC